MKYLDKVDAAKKLISGYSDKYRHKIIIGSSFGKDSMVVLDIARRIMPSIPVFGIMATTEFQETFDFSHKVAKDWDLNYKEYIYEQEDGFIEDLSKCCGKPKVETTKIALKNYDAWISGVRNTEGITRANFKDVEERGGLVKINPILYFTETDIWRYTALNNVPVNPMYKLGYRSLGCKFCSSPEEDENESERSGRWKNTTKAMGECGIHNTSLR